MIVMKRNWIFLILLLLLTACSSSKSENGLQNPKRIADYWLADRENDPENFSVSMEVFDDNTATITLFKMKESMLPVEEGDLLPFRIEGTDVKGIAQVNYMKVLKDEALGSDEMKSQAVITLIFKIDENTEESVKLAYSYPRPHSE